MGNWLVNHWFSAAVLVSLRLGDHRGSAVWGALGDTGSGGAPGGRWGVMGCPGAGLRGERSITSAPLITSAPPARPPRRPGEGGMGSGKLEYWGKTQLAGKGGPGELKNLKMILLCPVVLAGSLPRASSPLVRGGGCCENSWQGEELAPEGPSATAVLQHLWCNTACLASTHQRLSTV